MAEGVVSAPDTLGELLRSMASASPVELAGFAATLAVLVLGAYVGYQSYRGYRRNGSRAVLFLGVGIVLATTARQLVSIAVYLAVTRDPLVVLVVFFGCSTLGLLSVLYAFLRA